MNRVERHKEPSGTVSLVPWEEDYRGRSVFGCTYSTRTPADGAML